MVQQNTDNTLNIDHSDSELCSTDSSSQPPEDENFDPSKFFTNKEFMHYKMIVKFYKKCPQQDIDRMVGIIDSSFGISLRVLDWFVTRYSKKHIDFDSNNTDDAFDVHISYKAQLKSYKKRYFDPFRRRKKFYFHYNQNDESKKLYTTLGQLNFFKWAISNKIVDFVENNINAITRAMNQSNKDDKKNKERKKPKNIIAKTVKQKSTAKPIQINAEKYIDDDEIQIIVSFD